MLTANFEWKLTSIVFFIAFDSQWMRVVKDTIDTYKKFVHL